MHEKWYNKPATVKHMKKFGSVAFMHTPKKFWTKFQPKSKKVIMVGYDGHSQNYKFFDPVAKKFFVTGDVAFNECAVQSTVRPEENHNAWNWNVIKDAALPLFENASNQTEDQVDFPEEPIQEDAAAELVRPCERLRDRNAIQ